MAFEFAAEDAVVLHGAEFFEGTEVSALIGRSVALQTVEGFGGGRVEERVDALVMSWAARVRKRCRFQAAWMSMLKRPISSAPCGVSWL